ncbi:cyclin-domain-containing protein [Melampsora americana]|nr:cyclin-domain-containing protein [Melampsora americana]
MNPIQSNHQFHHLSSFCQTPLQSIIQKISNQLNHQLINQSTSTSIFTSPSSSHHSSHLSKFQAQSLPTITIQDYLTRIISFAPISIDSILLALLYLNRSTTLSINLLHSISSKSTLDLPVIPYHLSTIHRLLLSTLIVANKFISDRFLSASRASKVGGVPIPELASLERSLLFCLDFDLNFTLCDLNHVAEWVLNNDLSDSSSQSITSQVEPTETIPEAVHLPIINIEQLELKDEDEVKEDFKEPINSPPTLSISQHDPSPQLQSCSRTSSGSSSSSQPRHPSHSSSDLHSSLQLHSRSQSISDPKPIPHPQSISRSQSISHSQYIPNSSSYSDNPNKNLNQTTPRRRVFLRTHFVKDPRYNSNYLSTRPKVEEYEDEELKNATRIILTKLDSKGLKIQTELLGVSLITGEKICRTMSTQSIPL